MNIKNFFKKLISRRKKIGRLEYVNIPKLGLFNVSAKIDTGAYRGSIHAVNARVIKRKGDKILQFNVLDENHPEYNNVLHETKKFKKAKVRGTQSEFQIRYVVPVKIEIAGKVIKAELSLSDRTDLRHPILIGRKALRRFIIDVNKTYTYTKVNN
jgi:hypothetical protein